MRNEELGKSLNLNGISNPNALNNLYHRHVLSLKSQPSPSLSPFSHGFENNMISDDKWMCDVEDDVNVDVLLSNDFSRMSIFDEQGNVGAKNRGYGDVDPSLYTYTPYCLDAHAHIREGTVTPYMESSLNHKRNTCYGEVQLQKPFYASPFSCDCFLCSTRGRLFAIESDLGLDVKSPFTFSQPKLALNLNTPSSHYFPVTKDTATRVIAANSELPQSGGETVAFRCDSSFIIQEKDMQCCYVHRGCKCNYLGACRGSHQEFPQPVSSLHVSASHGKNDNSASGVSLSQTSPQKSGSLVEVQGYMYHLAKDQNGCRFLQRMIDEGTSEDTRRVFNGIIDNVVELIMDPFGNYLVQKLLDVCREDQILQIMLMLTREPRQLVRTSLNTHGTRVVQKIIGTINSRKQISLVRSAIQPCFLDLIKDLNGNHVIQRCLQCFSPQDNEFIFDAAAKFCVEIASHQHGCCVLQRCIDYSTGKYQDKLVKEVCRHGLLLAQDPFGNYVVQYIIEMENPSISAKLLSQFKGNYVNLSMQKFSSHVVEKCLKHVAESRSRIVQELLSVPHFEQLLQDPYANYVVQRALGVTKGNLHASLVEAVRPHKILRTSPYCKRIFSRNLLKK
ncbi:hypothetical protein VNO77_31537 [Canavalia gladiata]|uniref:PUM-HD domain-containing protein n=1 Tax=Canavalia gladiata TaxID=3824 RepID=A0AAN9KR22_CANGL